MYNLLAWAQFLGNPLDGTRKTNFMYFDGGRQISISMKTTDDVRKVEAFIKLNDGEHQLYCNVNPCITTAYGKPKDAEISEVMNLYIDVDPVKAAGMRKHPATDAEITAIPIDKICNAIHRKAGAWIYVDGTGNGYRIIVPVHDATPATQKAFVHHIHALFPDYIDTQVIDPSRITGIPGTMNVKAEFPDRQNRRRDSFLGHRRLTADPPTYTEDELAKIAMATSKPSGTRDRRTRHTAANPPPICGTVQQVLNKYILTCSHRTPWVLKLIASGPPEGNGFNYDGFFAAEVYNKIGDVPRVYATIMKAMWGQGYNARSTEKAWNDCVASGVGVWSKRTVAQKFGNSIFGDKQHE